MRNTGWLAVIFIVSAYLVGSIPTGYLIARMYGIQDIREHGSGTIGATNVARVLGAHFFPVIFLIDLLKAFLFLRLLLWAGASSNVIMLSAAALIAGNIYSLFLRFHGGKGVATMVGVFLALNPGVVIYLLVVWSVILLLTKKVGIASVVGLLFLPFVSVFANSSLPLVMLSCVTSLLCLIAHKDHLSSLLSGIFSK
jgi:glycerol-3-phosphate acyltransferase PlsY